MCYSYITFLLPPFCFVSLPVPQPSAGLLFLHLNCSVDQYRKQIILLVFAPYRQKRHAAKAIGYWQNNFF
jgi:hypothetical protein